MNERLVDDYIKAVHELQLTYIKINEMIKCKKVNGKTTCQVVSKTTGKPLSKPGMTKAAAIKRMKQVDYFKNKGK